MNTDKIELFFEELYQNFNTRNIEAVIAQTTENVQWANGMEGGHVHGHSGIREYWLRQFTMINPKVTPIDIEVIDNEVKVIVHQVVHDLHGNLLMDKNLFHHFYMNHDSVERFEIGDEIPD